MLGLFLTPQAILVFTILAVLYLVVKHTNRRAITHLPGPDSDSWLVGHLPNFQRAENAGEADLKWSEEFGLAFRTKACFGEDTLYLADPKALQHILNSGYKYVRPYEVRSRVQLSTGRGILWAEGDQHAKHRKIMNPAFSSSALRGMLPLFFDVAHKMVTVWKTTHHRQDNAPSVIDVSSWLTRTTLDIIGIAALGCNFNAIDGGGTELYNVYHNLFAAAHYMLSDFSIIFRRAMGFVPFWITDHLHLLPKKDIKLLNSCRTTVHKIGRSLLAQGREAYNAGTEMGKDIMSIFVKANLSEDPKRQLCDEEVISQIMTLILAGHETSANTLSWVLFELAMHRDVQRNLRDEIRATRAKVNARGGDKQLLISDLEAMKYNLSVIKESLRLYPVALQLVREAAQDDIIPLAQPQHTVSGEMVTTIPVDKGQKLILSLYVYNRLKNVWGNDADQWRPERFSEPLPSDDENKVSLGVLGSLASFGSGVRSCIGWRFAMLEMQALLIELIENFEFSPPPGDLEVKSGVAAIIVPMVKGQEKRGKQMPLTVTPIAQIPF